MTKSEHKREKQKKRITTMEITSSTTTTTVARTIQSTYSNVKFHNPLLCFSYSTVKPNSGFQAIRYPFHVIARKTRMVTCSLADDSNSNLATEVAVVNPSLAIKKKAMDVAPELKGTSIFLVGTNSSIKTTLGKLLADVLRYYYFDSDSLVEEAAGGAFATKSFRESDEKGFRESETEVLKQLSSMGRLVVCAGDGAVQSSTNLALLRHGISIWINVPVDIVAKDVIEDESQLPASEMLAELAAQYEEMRDGYATADATVSLQKVASQLGYNDLDTVTIEDMTMEVLMAIEKLTRVKKMMEEAARPF